MANASILAAFERMWQHITSALSNKSDTNHTHSDATQAASGFLSAEDKIQLDNGGIPIVTASSDDGVTYTATVDGISAFTSGMKFTIIPSMNSASVNVKLNVNSLGAKYIRMPVAYNSSATSAGALDTWIVKNKPITLEYDGTYFRTISMPRPSALYLYGTVPIAGGGTGATSAADALTNLGAQAQHIAATATLTASGWSDSTQTVSISDVTSSNTVIISPNPTSQTSYNEAGVYCSAQADGSLTFMCSTTPTEEITVNVLILN